MNSETFRTIVKPNYALACVQPRDLCFFIGSCFATNIGNRVRENLLASVVNPYGAAYNPTTIACQILRIVHNNQFSDDELVAYGNQYYSLLAHSDITASCKEELRTLINDTTYQAHTALRTAKLVCITLGTAWVFEDQQVGYVVANCHKLPAKRFLRRRLSVAEATDELSKAVLAIKSLNPEANIVLTVSPIRHLSDGAHANQVSKATLILAAEEVCQNTGAYYFPSYEMVLDDLRDYRFYADDMAHPSTAAVNYIYKAFAETFLSEPAKRFCAEAQKITAALAHRPFCKQSAEYQLFLEKNIERVVALAKQYGIDENNNNLARAKRELEKKLAESKKT